LPRCSAPGGSLPFSMVLEQGWSIMTTGSDGPSRGTNWIRLIARIWSLPIIVYALIMLVGYSWNWATTGVPDPYAVEDHPAMEALPPVLLFLSVLGLGIAWRWERLGGMISIVFVVATLVSLLVQGPNGRDFPRSAVPYLLTLVVAVPGILFLVSWWRSRQRSGPGA
jgi:hypothetical protein